MNKQINTILNVLSEAYQIPAEVILSTSRLAGHSMTRQMGYWLASQITDLSQIEISSRFHRFCPTTISFGIKQIIDRRDASPEFKDASDQLLTACRVYRDFKADPINLDHLGVGAKKKAYLREPVTKPDAEREYVSKNRKCLMHGGEFLSSHIGERVCPSCKSTSIWSSGVMA